MCAWGSLSGRRAAREVRCCAQFATASNDHRLGANEAPPAIISVYLGWQIENVFEQISSGNLTESLSAGMMDLGINALPVFMKDRRRLQSHFAVCIYGQSF